jgi:hypothetical protein
LIQKNYSPVWIAVLVGKLATGYYIINGGVISMKTIKKKLLILVIAAVMIAPAGCKRSEDGEGSAEQAGRKIDDALEKAGQETGKLMERVGESMQKAGENMQDSSKK